MISKTKELKNNIKKLGRDYQAKTDLLHNQYLGEDCYILSCGPSLNDYEQDLLKDKLKNKLVFSVKTTYNIYSDISDFLFFNCCNLPPTYEKPYHYEYNDSTISIASSNFPEGTRWSPIQKYDVFFKIPLVDTSTQMNEFLSINKNFDNYLISTSFNRPVGPGIMYETVIFMAVHLGVKSINTIGWDLSLNTTKTEQYDHFYPKDSKLFNPGSMMNWEIDATTKASKELYFWLKNKNIELNILTKNSSLYSGIPRKTL
jgi:hypothetical protein